MILDTLHRHLLSFYVPWAAAVAAAPAIDLKVGSGWVILNLAGFEIPLVRSALAIVGVLIARFLAPRREPQLGVLKRVLVTLTMAIVAVAWVMDARPGVLFAFVVGIGLGFSGYTLIELAGREIEGFVKSIFAKAAGALNVSSEKEK